MPLAELCALSNFTFLTGASHPEEMMLAASEAGLSALAITDVNSVAGIVRAHQKAREIMREGGGKIRLVPGARLVLGSASGHVLGHVLGREASHA